MSSTVVANMKFCDKKNIVTATLKDDGTVDIEIKSDCKNVQYYAEHLKNVTIDDVSNVRNSKIVDPDIRQSMSAPCLTPNAVFYAAWLELGMLSKSRAKLVETNEIIFDIGE